MHILLIIGIAYVVGFFTSLVFLSKFGEQIGWGGYDPPHDSWYDDYESNASAYVAFSIAWPLFYFVNIIAWNYEQLITFVRLLIKINK